MYNQDHFKYYFVTMVIAIRGIFVESVIQAHYYRNSSQNYALFEDLAVIHLRSKIECMVYCSQTPGCDHVHNTGGANSCVLKRRVHSPLSVANDTKTFCNRNCTYPSIPSCDYGINNNTCTPSITVMGAIYMSNVCSFTSGLDLVVFTTTSVYVYKKEINGYMQCLTPVPFENYFASLGVNMVQQTDIHCITKDLRMPHDNFLIYTSSHVTVLKSIGEGIQVVSNTSFVLSGTTYNIHETTWCVWTGDIFYLYSPVVNSILMVRDPDETLIKLKDLQGSLSNSFFLLLQDAVFVTLRGVNSSTVELTVANPDYTVVRLLIVNQQFEDPIIVDEGFLLF